MYYRLIASEWHQIEQLCNCGNIPLRLSRMFQNVIEYNKYLQEVVKVLESDPSFREKLDKAEESDIRVSCFVIVNDCV